jgi:hypothetical protein
MTRILYAQARRDRWLERARRTRWGLLRRFYSEYALQAEFIRREGVRELQERPRRE